MTDDVAEATTKHRRATSHITQIAERKAARLVGRHIITHISYSTPIHLVCVCEERIDADTSLVLETLWKYHKREVGERSAP